MKTLPRLILLGTVVLSCVSCDQVTKAAAGSELAGRPPLSFFGDTVRLYYAENPGGFLSLGADMSEPLRSFGFAGFTAVMVIGLLTVAIRDRSLDRLQLTAMALVIAGGAGNLIDRLLLGTVRDFLNVGIGSLRTGIFNVADFAVLMGAAILCVSSLRGRWTWGDRVD